MAKRERTFVILLCRRPGEYEEVARGLTNYQAAVRHIARVGVDNAVYQVAEFKGQAISVAVEERRVLIDAVKPTTD